MNDDARADFARLCQGVEELGASLDEARLSLREWASKAPDGEYEERLANVNAYLENQFATELEAEKVRPSATDTKLSKGASGPHEEPEADGLNVRWLADVRPRKMEWLWKPRIPLGVLTMFDGDPEKAKSTVLLELIARGSRGREMPDDQAVAPFRSVILSAEDPAETVIRPRFDEFGGDPSMVAIIESVRKARDRSSRLIDLTADLPALRRKIAEIQPRLVGIDPITAYLGTTDSFKDSAVRAALGPLVAMAEELRFAFVVIRHLNKAIGYSDVLYRGGGSIGFIAAARSGLMALRDPDDEGRNLLAHYKCNVAMKAPTLAYRIVSSSRDADLPVIEWLGTDPRSAKQIHEAAQESPAERGARGTARGFLNEMLADGEKEAAVVYDEAKSEGIAKRTLDRAASDLKVLRRKVGFAPSVWYWRRP